MASDRFRKLVESTVHGVLAKQVKDAFQGVSPKDVGNAVTDALTQVKSVPVCAMKVTDIGPVMIFDAALLLNKTAADLRNDQLVIPKSIPDRAVVMRNEKNTLMFVWRPIEAAADAEQNLSQ